MRKKIKTYAVCAALLVSLLVYGQSVVSAQPGDASDPVVTKAYVDAQINQLKSMIDGLSAAGSAHNPTMPSVTDTSALMAEVLAQIEILYGDVLRQAALNTVPQYTPPAPEAASFAYEVLFMPVNQMLIAYSGTEIILRGGSAVAVTGENGLVDVTGGSDIISGMNVPLNHLLVVPATDGRGMRSTSDAYLMIKGGYYIVE
jgi:hypothetical protein